MTDPESQPSRPPRPTAGELSSAARRLYDEGPALFRRLQHYRPYICPFEELIPLVPSGSRVLDVGCGGGLFLTLMADRIGLGDSIGFDANATVIGLAQGAAQRAQLDTLEFRHLAVEEAWPEGEFDVVSIIDVMHHVPPDAQRDVIKLCAQHVKPGGILLYKDMCRRPLWRAWMNRLHDLVLARQWIHYAPVQDVVAWARIEGLTLERSTSMNRLWYGHELRVFRKPA